MDTKEKVTAEAIMALSMNIVNSPMDAVENEERMRMIANLSKEYLKSNKSNSKKSKLVEGK